MLTVGPSQYDRPGDPVWWVTVNRVLVASMVRHAEGDYRVALDLHYATHDRHRPRFPGKRPKHLRLHTFDTDRLTRWANANAPRLLRECPPPPPPPPPPDLRPEGFALE